MKITAGDQTIRTGVPRADAVYRSGVRCQALRIPLTEGINDEQLAALIGGSITIATDAGDAIPGGTHEGYNTLVSHEVVIARVLEADQRVAEAQAQAAQAQADNAQTMAILRGEAVQADKPEVAAMRQTMDNYINMVAQDPVAINGCIVAIRDWAPGAHLRGDVRQDGAIPYWALHDHDSTATPEQRPSATPSMWAHYHGTSPETARPFVGEGHNPYMVGHYCTDNGAVYRCKADNVIHAPNVRPEDWDLVA